MEISKSLAPHLSLCKGADRRAAKVPSKHESKAKKADETFGAPGSTAIRGALRALPKYGVSPWKPLANSISPSTSSSMALPMRARHVLEDTSHQTRPKIDAGDASLLMGSIN